MAAEGEFYKKLSASELSAIISKESLSSNDHDTGFYSGTSEGEDNASVDYSNRLETKSPTDRSEDSIDIKITPINLQQRHKRKGTEPSKIVTEKDIGPNRKRIRYTLTNDIHNETKAEYSNQSWDEITNESPPLFDPCQILNRHPGVTTFHRNIFDSPTQSEPLALIVKKPSSDTDETSFQIQNDSSYSKVNNSNIINHNDESLTTTTVPINNSSFEASERNLKNKQRNYKNMSRERRIEANARERTRVHTISAAYETLRRAIPSYAHRQKLSKLSVLRIASSYILTLSRMVGSDYSECQDAPSISDCFDVITKTIQNEGKLRKKKDD